MPSINMRSNSIRRTPKSTTALRAWAAGEGEGAGEACPPT